MSLPPPGRGWEQQPQPQQQQRQQPPQTALRGESRVSADMGGGRGWGALPEEASPLPSSWEAHGLEGAKANKHATAAATVGGVMGVGALEEASTDGSPPLNDWHQGQPLLSHQRQQKQQQQPQHQQPQQQQMQQQMQQLQRGDGGGSRGGGSAGAPVASGWGSLEQDSQRKGQEVLDAAQTANRFNLKVKWDGCDGTTLSFFLLVLSAVVWYGSW